MKSTSSGLGVPRPGAWLIPAEIEVAGLRVDAILERLKRPSGQKGAASALDLLGRYDREDYSKEWNEDPEGPRVYRAFMRKLIDEGYPTAAIKLGRRWRDREDAAKATNSDPIVRYLIALAFVRGGSPGSAEKICETLIAEAEAGVWTSPAWTPAIAPADISRLTGDVLAQNGRLFKERALRSAPGSESRKKNAAQSVVWYAKGAERVAANAFQLGNAATMRYVQGDPIDAQRLAKEALAAAQKEVAADPSPRNYWPHATAGEACLLLGRKDEAIEYYETAVAAMLELRDRGALAAMIPNLRLLSEENLPFDINWITSRIGGVVAFSGHRIDPPWHTTGGRKPRLPNDQTLLAEISKQIDAELDRINARFGFCSLACGADILFAEAMMKRNADLQIVLPFAEPDFVRLSVDYDQPDEEWKRWNRRFQGVLGYLTRSDAKFFATDEPHLGSDQLFAYANEVLQGMAILRAQQLSVKPTALLVIDQSDLSVRTGGARDFGDMWDRRGLATAIINIAALRDDDDDVEAIPPCRVSPPPPDSCPLPRPVRAMLFADVAGFSKLKEERSPEFFLIFPQIVAAALDSVGSRLLLKNTWGDGVFAVFGSEDQRPESVDATASGVEAAADAALHLIEHFRERADDWKRLGFIDPNPIRIGLHTGPVFELNPDPVLGRKNYFGQHVNRTARIEPITLPGAAFASEQFAALLTVAAPTKFSCEFVGVEPLAKNYATAPLYQVRRRDGG